MSLESISEWTLTERGVGNLNLSFHLAAVDQRFFPVYRSAIFLLDNVEAVGHCSNSHRQLFAVILVIDLLIMFYLNDITTFWSFIFNFFLMLLDPHALNLAKQLIDFCQRRSERLRVLHFLHFLKQAIQLLRIFEILFVSKKLDQLIHLSLITNWYFAQTQRVSCRINDKPCKFVGWMT